MPITNISRDWGVSPSIVRIITTDTLAEIQVAGYFSSQAPFIEAINKGEWEWAPSDVAAVKCSDGQGFFVYDSATSSFVPDTPIGNDYATRELDNLQNVAINANLDVDTDFQYDLGSEEAAWLNVHAWSVKTTTQNAATTEILAFNTLSEAYDPFITLTAGNPPTCNLEDGVTAVTQAPGNSSTLVATTEYVQTELGGYANTELSNIGSTAVGADILPDSDDTRDLGASTAAWREIYTNGLRTGDSNTTPMLIDVYNTNTTFYETFATLTPGNPPTFVLDGAVVGTTQALGDNSTKLATTAYVDSSIAAGTMGIATVSLPVTAAQFKAMYTTPLLLIAGVGGTYIRIESAILHMLAGGTVAYADGGAILLQYGNTIHGAGVAATNTIAAATVIAWGTTPSIVLTEGVLTDNTMANINAGIYLSCQTGDFTAGDANFVLDISYSVFSTT